jgi:hypothetical protein
LLFLDAVGELSHLIIANAHLIEETIVLLPKVVDPQHHPTHRFIIGLILLFQLGYDSIQLVDLLPLYLELSLALSHNLLHTCQLTIQFDDPDLCLL